MADTELNQDTSEGEGIKTDSKEGELDTDTSNQNKDQEEKKLSQSEVNEVVKRAKQDAERAAKTKFDKTLEGKHVLTEDELSAKVQEAVKAALAEKEASITREKLQTEYNLTEKQIAVVASGDEKEMRKEIEELFGKPKKEAPVLNGGSETNNDVQKPSTFAEKSRQQINELKKKHHIK